MTRSATALLTLLALLAALLSIMAWAARRTHNAADFAIANRRLGPWLVTLSYAATGVNAWMLMTVAAAAFLWAAAPVAAGYFFRRQVESLLAWVETMGTGVLAVVGTLVIFYIVVKLIQRVLLVRFLRMIRIDVHELSERIRSGLNPLILDARSHVAREFEPRRIPGAIPVDLESVEQVIDRVPPGGEVVVYCS